MQREPATTQMTFLRNSSTEWKGVNRKGLEQKDKMRFSLSPNQILLTQWVKERSGTSSSSDGVINVASLT
ncbi:hypothetical protein CEXT_521571 [Caerostris extrusa]|uniref:Uncharacterized protein n=1 Tax=Caerostris extrusa TaxID=172846 RepID=A0AAV4XY66_CAEEX|nr:hypothetical protein CEXT_521571 [Caerostris extrusa]